MRRILVTAAVAILLAAPALATATDNRPKLWRWPALPSELPEQPGSVLVTVSLRGAVEWSVVDGVVVAPPEGMSCAAAIAPERPAG